MFPQCQNSLSFLGKAAGLGTDEPILRQNIVIIAFHYNKTVSLSSKTNKVHLKDIISDVIHRVAKIQGLTLGSVRLGKVRPKGNRRWF